MRPKLHSLARRQAHRGMALLIVLSGLFAFAPSASASIRFVKQWGSVGSGDGQFSNEPYDYGPRGIATDSAGNVYVPDPGNARIEKFSSSGAFLGAWGWGVKTGADQYETCTGSCQAGSFDLPPANGQFQRPWGIATDSSENVYVVGYFDGLIQKFSSSGAFLTRWERGGGEHAHGIATDSSGNLYIANGYSNYLIEKYDSSGSFLTGWGSSGHSGADGEFELMSSPHVESPRALATDASGNVYVVDPWNYRIQKFDSSGDFLGAWGWGVKTGAHRYETCAHSCQAGISGSGNGQFSFSYRDDNDGIATDPSGNVYVADTQNNRIEKFSSSGAFLAKWGYSGTGDEQFYPEALATDSFGNVYVVDRSNYRIVKFHDGFAVGRSGSTLVVTATPGAKDNLVITRPSASTPAGNRLPQRCLYGLRPQRGNGLHPKRRLHGQLQRRRDHPDSSHRRRPGRQGRQLDRRSKLALRRERLRRAHRRLRR